MAMLLIGLSATLPGAAGSGWPKKPSNHWSLYCALRTEKRATVEKVASLDFLL